MPLGSPQPTSAAAVPSSPRSNSTARPAPMKRTSSQGTTPYSVRNTGKSPGPELDLQPLRHAVRPKGHARVVLPRNLSSGRNLAKMARQVAETGNGSKPHTHQRTHEGDTDIRLPGSLDESEARPPPMRRNMTSYQLPRNTSHTKLKKNFSHGQLQRLGSGKDLAGLALTKQRPPTSPALKGKSKRPKSADWTGEKDLHEQEVELARQMQEEKDGRKKVGFAVGSVADDEEEDVDRVQNMEGSGLDEGEWTEESASASPFSTRLNTANNSRRTSVHEKPSDKSPRSNHTKRSESQRIEETESESTEVLEAEDEAATDSTPVHSDREGEREQSQEGTVETSEQDRLPTTPQHPQSLLKPQRSPLHAAKEHPNPTAHVLERSHVQLPAPALVSNVTAVDDATSTRTSPAASLRSANVAVGEQDPGELVSRFVPSTSVGSGSNTTSQNTPKTSSFHTPDHETSLHAHHRDRPAFSLGHVSPGSTVSGSSGAATPAHGRSRIELKMLQEKAVADLESAAEKGPIIPAHVYDRRNESLKSYLHLAALSQAGGLPSTAVPLSLGPEIFQGRFKAVNAELKVVEKFRDPIAECVGRLQACRGSKLNARTLPQKQAAALRMTKSAVSLPSRSGAPPKREYSLLTGSVSPTPTEDTPTMKPALMASKSSMQIKPPAGRRAATRGVSFAGMELMRESDKSGEEASLDEVAREMWDNVLT